MPRAAARRSISSRKMKSSGAPGPVDERDASGRVVELVDQRPQRGDPDAGGDEGDAPALPDVAGEPAVGPSIRTRVPARSPARRRLPSPRSLTVMRRPSGAGAADSE